MPYYAQIRNDRVLAVTQTHSPVSAPDMVPIASLTAVTPGMLYANGVFSAPPASSDPRKLWMRMGAFKDRFGPDGPAIYASSHSACKGGVGLLEGRGYVDLANPLIGQMIDVLIAAGQPAADPVWPGSGPMTFEKKAAILNPVTLEHEREIKGLG